MIEKIERFLTLHQEHQKGTYSNPVRMKAAEVNFIELSTKVRDKINKPEI